MSSVGYLVAAYLGAAGLYVGYVLWLRGRERALERRLERGSGGRAR